MFLKKYFLVKNYKKQMSYKENKVGLQKPIKFRLSTSIALWHFPCCLKMKNHLGVSLSHFLQNVSIEIQILVSKACKFLIVSFAIS